MEVIMLPSPDTSQSHKPAAGDTLSGRTNLEVLAHLGGHPRSRVDQLLELVELSDRARDPLRKYSQGMKQRLGVTMVYVLVPESIIAMVWPQGSQWFPVRTLNFLPGSALSPDVGPTPPQGYPTALGVALLWMIGFVVVSAVVFQRQDASA